MNKNDITTIRVRRGINGFKYSACDDSGYFIGNFEHLREVRLHWLQEIRWGKVRLVRELDKMPDMSKIEQAKETVECIMHLYTNNY